MFGRLLVEIRGEELQMNEKKEMTREETIAVLAESKRQNEVMRDNPSTFWASHQMADGVKNAERRIAALDIALSALRPVSREEVEKSWAGCEYCEKHKINLVRIEMNYNDSPGSPKRLNPTRVPKFCPICGRPLTDEAVDMVMERMEALKDG